MRRENELFIGRQYLNIEGREIKHPALISIYANNNIRKISDKPLELLGVDLETNHLTSELKLLGFYDNGHYSYHTSNFLNVLFSLVRYCDKNEKSIAYWNKLDPFVLYKQFLLLLSPEKQTHSLKRFAKISGEWSNKKGFWKLQPVVEVEMNDYYFGIKNVVRSSIQFFYYHKGDSYLHEVWAYDIAQLFENGLEREALGKLNKETKQYEGGRLPYYTKVSEEVHKINWDRFESDLEFRNLVLYSNELDARAVHDLGIIIQNEFKTAFGWYPKTLISQGSLARSAVVATLMNKYASIEDKRLKDMTILEEVKSIAFINHYDYIAETFGEHTVKDLYALACETYSGGYIETLRYGFTDETYIADITSAYPDTIRDLLDLRDMIITNGTGTPPHIKNSYCFIRGTVNIPMHINYHPVTVKHPTNKSTNIRAVGEYIASYTIEERDYLLTVGATFENETWYNIETKGILSPLAECCMTFYNLRMKLRKEKNTAQFMAKIAMNSLYGILFEAVDTYEEITQEVERCGFRAGEFFNPIYASIITSRTRIKLAKAGQAIENKNSLPILIMTDSIAWKGKFEDLPSYMWTEDKTLGYFEKPKLIKNMLCLGSGRYQYEDTDGKKQTKQRGLNVTPEEVHNENGIVLQEFDWLEAMKKLVKTNSTKMKVKVRVLVSVGMVLHNSNYNVNQLGLVCEEKREVDLLVGKNKRNYDETLLNNPKLLASKLLPTESLYLGFGMDGTPTLNDQTLPKLREKMFEKKVLTKVERTKKNNVKASRNYYDKNREKIKETRKNLYTQLLDIGFTSDEARKMKNWKLEKIDDLVRERGFNWN